MSLFCAAILNDLRHQPPTKAKPRIFSLRVQFTLRIPSAQALPCHIIISSVHNTQNAPNENRFLDFFFFSIWKPLSDRKSFVLHNATHKWLQANWDNGRSQWTSRPNEEIIQFDVDLLHGMRAWNERDRHTTTHFTQKKKHQKNFFSSIDLLLLSVHYESLRMTFYSTLFWHMRTAPRHGKHREYRSRRMVCVCYMPCSPLMSKQTLNWKSMKNVVFSNQK